MGFWGEGGLGAMFRQHFTVSERVFAFGDDQRSFAQGPRIAEARLRLTHIPEPQTSSIPGGGGGGGGGAADPEPTNKNKRTALLSAGVYRVVKVVRVHRVYRAQG